MAKKNSISKWINFLFMIAGAIALVGVGGLFIDGNFLTTILLKYLPEVVHTVTGYLLVASGIGSLIFGINELM